MEGGMEGRRAPELLGSPQEQLWTEGAELPALEDHPRTSWLGASHPPPLTAWGLRPTSTEATHGRGEPAQHQPGSDPAPQRHRPGKGLPSRRAGGTDGRCWEQQPRAGARPRAGRGKATAPSPHPSVQHGLGRGDTRPGSLHPGEGSLRGLEAAAKGGRPDGFPRGPRASEQPHKPPRCFSLCLPPRTGTTKTAHAAPLLPKSEFH